MPMNASRVKRFLESRGRSAPLADAALQAAWPLYLVADRRRYELAGAVRLDAAPTVAAIAGATARKVERIVLYSCADARAFRAPPYGGDVPYPSGLAGALFDAHWTHLARQSEERFGSGCRTVKDELWNALRHDIVYPLQLEFWDDPDGPPRVGVGESVVTTLFYFFFAAAVGDGDRAALLDPLVRLLPRAVPVCEDPTQASAWLVALPPIATKR